MMRLQIKTLVVSLSTCKVWHLRETRARVFYSASGSDAEAFVFHVDDVCALKRLLARANHADAHASTTILSATNQPALPSAYCALYPPFPYTQSSFPTCAKCCILSCQKLPCNTGCRLQSPAASFCFAKKQNAAIGRRPVYEL
jgi:hypothetical protein